MRRSLSLSGLLAIALLAPATLLAQAPDRVMGAPYRDPSRAFIDLMLTRNEMVVMMSEHAMTAARNDAVKAMARRMLDSQRAEIAALRAERKALFGSDSSRPGMMREMMAMMGMMDSMHMRMRDTMTRMPMDTMRTRDTTMRMPMDTMRMPMDTMRMPHPAPARPGARPMQGMPMPMGMQGDMDRMYLSHMIGHAEEGMDIAVLAEHSTAAARVKRVAQRLREARQRDVVEMRRLLGTLPASPAAGMRD